METQHTKHCTYKIGYHFVWCPKYRKAILTGEVAHCIEQEIRDIAQKNAWEIRSLSIQEDHIHLFLSTPPRFAPSGIVNVLKGITARQVFKKFPEVHRSLWGGNFWSRSYYVGTVGDMSADTVQKYIEEGQD